jgi:uncharacterized OB-fold protein
MNQEPFMSAAPRVSPVLPPIDDPESAPFWEAARSKRLVVPACADCGFLKWPPRAFCSQCNGRRTEWRTMSGRGSLWSYAIVHNPTMEAFWPVLPLPIALIELEDAPELRMAGSLAAAPGAPINSLPHDRLKIGMKLRVTFEEITPEVLLPRWVPAEGGAS